MRSTFYLLHEYKKILIQILIHGVEFAFLLVSAQVECLFNFCLVSLSCCIVWFLMSSFRFNHFVIVP